MNIKPNGVYYIINENQGLILKQLCGATKKTILGYMEDFKTIYGNDSIVLTEKKEEL